MNDLEQPTDNRQEEVKRMDPYVNKLPELVREQKKQIDDLKNVQRRLKKNLMKVIVTAVILGVLLVVTGFFPIRTTIVPWLRENLATEVPTKESTVTDSSTTESVVVESSTSESSVSEPTVTDESDAENVEQEKDTSATDNQESDNSRRRSRHAHAADLKNGAERDPADSRQTFDGISRKGSRRRGYNRHTHNHRQKQGSDRKLFRLFDRI